jgi:hypothetical protein
MSCLTPVVFLIFRRPDLTARVFETIRQAKPAKLLIVADGDRTGKKPLYYYRDRNVTDEYLGVKKSRLDAIAYP